MTFISTVGSVFSVDWVIFGDSVFWGDDDGSAVWGFVVACWLSEDVLVGCAVGGLVVEGWLPDDFFVDSAVGGFVLASWLSDDVFAGSAVWD